MKKLLTSLMAVMFVLLAIAPAAFAETPPNWYWIYSDNMISEYIDTNSIVSNIDVKTNTVHKIATVKISSFDKAKGYGKAILEFKRENDAEYYRTFSAYAYDADDNVIADINEEGFKRWRNIATQDESVIAVANLLFVKKSIKD